MHRKISSFLKRTVPFLVVACIALGTQVMQPSYAASKDLTTAHPSTNANVAVMGPAPSLPAYVSDIAALSRTDIWSAGSAPDTDGYPIPVMRHFDGIQWSEVKTPDLGRVGEFLHLAAVSANDIWVNGDVRDGYSSSAFLEHWDGTAWTIMNYPHSSFSAGSYITLNDVVAKKNGVWLTGNYTYYVKKQPIEGKFIDYFNGQRWQAIEAGLETAGALDHLDVLAPDNIWAINGGRTFHFDGKRWHEIPNKPNVQLVAISGDPASSNLWIVGHDESFQALSEHWNGKQWQVVNIPTILNPSNGTQYSELTSVFTTAANDVWALGYVNDGLEQHYGTTELFEHWNGRVWTQVNLSALDLLRTERLGTSNTLVGIGTYLGYAHLLALTY